MKLMVITNCHISRIRRHGFTLVELLVVVVVISILASITIVSYNGIQQRARNAQRVQDINSIVKAVQLFYADNGSFPVSSCSASCKINASWSSTSDGSWANLEAQLVPKYLSVLPKDPLAKVSTGPAIFAGANNYSYDFVSGTVWCGAVGRQSFMLAYRLEAATQTRTIEGDCSSGTQPTDYGPASEYYSIVK